MSSVWIFADGVLQRCWRVQPQYRANGSFRAVRQSAEG